jgi:4-hydroxy-tetrahydrodipicolinate synthase
MKRGYTRREYLKLAGAAAIAPALAGTKAWAAERPDADATRPAPRPAEDMRGIFVILATPYTAAGAVDDEDLVRQVDWLARAGAHGLVWPQNSSGYARLSTDEIMHGMEVLVRASRGKGMTLVLGVQRDGTKEMVELARFADSLGPEMVIAMPPKVGSSLEDYREYYSALAETTSRPVMIQTIPNLPGLDFSTDLILELATRYPHLGYVKEEGDPVFDRMTDLIGQPQIRRVFSAKRGRHFLYDLRHGVDGIVSGMSMYADVFVRMWAEYRAGNWDAVRDIHARVLAMLMVEEEVPGAGRYLLERRGIFKSMAQPGSAPKLSTSQIAHVEHALAALEEYMV